MAQKECPSCAMQVKTSEEVCPICNYEFAVTHRSYSIYVIVAILLLATFVWFYVL
jgi:RNA polymerase subunit RPABC4/transcription elongation factor Spt4